MDRNGSFWMSMVKKCEKRNHELDEKQCNLQHRLKTLKQKISSSHQNTIDHSSAESSSSCSCSNSSSGSANESPKNSCCLLPPTTEICAYKPKSSDNLVHGCDNQSMNSMELQYIAKVHDLVNRENEIKKQVRAMEIKEKAFIDTLKRADQIYATMKTKYKKRLTEEGKGKNTKYEKMTQELLEENSCLCDQLQDAKLELKQCIEKLQGPIARQMDQEKRRSMQLENDLKLASQQIEDKECCRTKDVCELQKKLAATTKNLTDINDFNETLQKQMCSLSRKYKELQTDLVNQKINEAHNLERVNEIMLEKQRVEITAPVSTKETQFSLCGCQVETVSESLHAIARKLSKTMSDVNECFDCSTVVSQDLKDTVLGIVRIADIVDKGCKLNKGVNAGDDFNDKKPPPSSGKGQQNQDPKSSCFMNEQTVRDDNFDEPTQLDIEKNNHGGIVDNETYATVESLSSRSSLLGKIEVLPPTTCQCQRTKIEERLVQKKEKLCKGTTDKGKIEDSRIAPVLHEASDADVHVLTQVETIGDLEIAVETRLELCKKNSDDIHVTTAFTTSGMLEVVTEGPAGIIETTITLTPSGSVDVVTRIIDFTEDFEKSELLSITSELISIKDKISAVQDVIVVSEIRPADTVEESLSFVDSLSITDELSEIEDSIDKLPPAEPVVKKPKLETGVAITYEQVGGGEVEEYNVEIEINHPPFIRKLAILMDEEKEQYFGAKTMKKTRENVVFEKANEKVADALEKFEYVFAPTINKISGGRQRSEETGAQELELSVSVHDRASHSSSTTSRITSSTTFGSSMTSALVPTQLSTMRSKETTLVELEKRIKIEGGDAFRSVRDTDGKLKKFKNDQIDQKFQSGEGARAVPKLSVMARRAECDCDSCLCEECSPKIMSARSGDNYQPTECSSQQGDASGNGEPHPPDCDCIECLCKPCASFPPDYQTRVHPPECDCTDCLCIEAPCCGEATKAASGCETIPTKEIDYSEEVQVLETSKNAQAPHDPNCECDTCKCCKCEKSEKPCGPCDQESHLPNCTCIDCLLICGTRDIIVENEEVSKTPSYVIEEKCNPYVISQKEIGHDFNCGCSACKLACGNECGMCMPPFLEETDGLCMSPFLEETDEELATVIIEPVQNVQETNVQPESVITASEQVVTPQKTPKGQCDCEICKDICDNPTCAQILADTKTVHKDVKMKEELNDLQACLDKINCACAEAEATVCQPSRSKGTLLAFRGMVENLQEKCKEKDKVVSGMIKEMKSKMDRNFFFNLLGLTSKEPEVIEQNDIYCCSCDDDDRTKMEDFSRKPCKCGSCTDNTENTVSPFVNAKSSDSTSSSSCCSCCSCCTEFEDAKEIKQLGDAYTDSSCSCSLQESMSTLKKPKIEDRYKHRMAEKPGKRARTGLKPKKNIKSASVDTCPYCNHQEKSVEPDIKKLKLTKHKEPGHRCFSESKKLDSSPTEPQRLRICMKPDTLQRETKNALLAITEMRKIADALLVKWSKAKCKDLSGYEVVIDGQIKSKIRSAERTSALIYSVTSKKPITVTVYALTPEGRCLPSAKAVFDV